MTISRDGTALELPASRKLLALFAYLTLAPRAVARSQLCELLWDVPNDPRGALRWCLSKIRRVVDEPERQRVQTPSDAVQFDLSDCFVDAIEVLRAAEAGIEHARGRTTARVVATVQRRISRRARDRPRADLQRLAYGGTAPFPRAATWRCSSTSSSANGRRSARVSRPVAAAGAVRSARSRTAVESAGSQQSYSRSGSASRRYDTGVRGRGTRRRADPRGVARGAVGSERGVRGLGGVFVASGSRHRVDRCVGFPSRVHRGDAVRRRSRGGFACARQRAGARRHHAARATAQSVRHCAGHACSHCTIAASVRKKPVAC